MHKKRIQRRQALKALGGAGLGLAFSGLAAFTLLPCLLARTMGRRSSLPERDFEPVPGIRLWAYAITL